jgi:hypothetical protein
MFVCFVCLCESLKDKGLLRQALIGQIAFRPVLFPPAEKSSALPNPSPATITENAI